MSRSALPPGTAPIKPEFLVSVQPRDIPDDDAAEGGSSHVNGRQDGGPGGEDAGEGGKRQSGAQRKKFAKDKKQRGANKGRRFQKVRDDLELCFKVASGKPCEFGDECRSTHDVAAYLAAKPKDIHFPSPEDLSNTPPFVRLPDVEMVEDGDASRSSLDVTTTCAVFQRTGECKYGLKCRFLGNHAKLQESGELELIVDEEKKARAAVAETELNFIDADSLRKIRTKKYPHPISDAYLKELQDNANEPPKKKEDNPQTTVVDPETAAEPAPVEGAASTETPVAAQEDTPDVPVRFAEKKRLHWKGKTYLAPLTTVGNLPFRRLCVDYGADITCGEMGLAMSFLQGSKEEWSLVRRHPSETTFGMQIAGSKPQLLVPAAEIIGRECVGNLDFVDVNCGCPIDLVYKTGSGSALLDAAGKLGKIVVGMNKALGDIPVTVKLRTGVKDGKNTAHKLMPRLAPEFGASAITLHGRTRQQRYTKLADWEYIKQCVEAVRAREEEEDLAPVPIFGGGDCFSSEDYWHKMDNYNVDGIMIGRGALIKPWIFTEIKERREWDISARERLELARKYAEYGLNHFGSDTAGVNTTRRYLCEALSFQYRYIPIGLLETLPSRINDRAPAFKGRDELETLLASPDSRDWMKISEMFLGPAPESWTFTPKHKSNAFGTEESQG
ncbi:zinc finger dihydrouridine synthase [Trametes versicolor FP-101664 SS1]|uniref:zinc finger dihydrouridine synthase n=1 Tax=Trametes versicolor (strain FP-101664) TaxID=717944 RepID=UPI000462193C|nr:zinc finger dihydrouridine synthase [Trametes versicolor FP-101664 SS1]EIW53580.1 zinc finger dihydrouridine synthase [Trametes versicolor FP-101664 SS1]